MRSAPTNTDTYGNYVVTGYEGYQTVVQDTSAAHLRLDIFPLDRITEAMVLGINEGELFWRKIIRECRHLSSVGVIDGPHIQNLRLYLPHPNISGPRQGGPPFAALVELPTPGALRRVCSNTILLIPTATSREPVSAHFFNLNYSAQLELALVFLLGSRSCSECYQQIPIN